MAQGHPPPDIAATIAETWPTENGDQLLADAMQCLVDAGAIDSAIVRGFITVAAQEIYGRCFAVSDYSGARDALKLLASLHGV